MVDIEDEKHVVHRETGIATIGKDTVEDLEWEFSIRTPAVTSGPLKWNGRGPRVLHPRPFRGHVRDKKSPCAGHTSNPTATEAATQKTFDYALKPNSVEMRSGRAWAYAIGTLLNTGEGGDVVAALGSVADVVCSMVSSELGQAGLDFAAAVDRKRATCPHDFTSTVEVLVISIAKRFQLEATACLPQHVIQYIMGFVALADNGILCSVSKEFREVAEHDCLWRDTYEERFGKLEKTIRAGTNSILTPARRHGTDRSVRAPNATMTSTAPYGETRSGFKRTFIRRLIDPQVGDKVEVAWSGKFRLESLEVYNGMAWWLAHVVAKDVRPGYYQVHYPGWDARWDEWVPRERLRWGNERRANALRGVQPGVGDSVEMWCQGVHVPGAWLQAVVHSVKDGRLNLGEMLTAGHFWVDASHVRVVKSVAVEGRKSEESCSRSDGMGRLAWISGWKGNGVTARDDGIGSGSGSFGTCPSVANGNCSIM